MAITLQRVNRLNGAISGWIKSKMAAGAVCMYTDLGF